jgi:hypothetical protein
MKNTHLFRIPIVVLASVFSAAFVFADVVEIKGGARIVGKVSKIDGGAVVVSTDYAGAITIKQSEVVGITTDAPIAVRLNTGTRIDGKVSGSDGAMQIAGSEGVISTTVDKVAASWAAGGKDPAIAALERGWAFEAAVDVAGKTGNKEQLGTGFSFRATLAGSQDKLQFYSAYDRQITDGLKSADQFKAGVDYSNNFKGSNSWYVRNEGGFDRVKDIELYDVAAVGMGYDFIQKPKQVLTGRAGLSFRYAGYKNVKTEDVKAAGLDFGLAHRYEMKNSVLNNRISYVPTFEDFSNFVITHESTLELPLLSTQWKLRLGVANDYNSKPGKGVDRLDTTYFTRLVLNWR